MQTKPVLLTLFLLIAFNSQVAAQETADSIKILSYNIHMWQIDVDDLADLIRDSEADVVGLNEAWDKSQNDRLAEKLGYNIVYGGQNPRKEHQAKPHTINDYYMPQVLLTKHKIVSSKLFNAMAAKDQPSFDPTVPIYRGGTLALLETEKGTRFVVFVLHLHPWGDGNNDKMTTMRLEEITGIVKQLEPYQNLPRILVGDFNTRSHQDEAGGWKVTRYLEEAGYADLFRTLHTSPQTHPGLTCGNGRIDYIFYSERFKPIQSRVVKEGVFGSKGYDQSDHLGVFGQLQFPAQTQKQTPQR